jgi:signal transduction histidine kinase
MQEALNNVARHSGAKEAWVKLRSKDRAIEMDVEDHGRGFDTTARGNGLGVIAMRERAEMLGGTIEFLRPPAGGTLVRLKVPIGQTAASSDAIGRTAGASDRGGRTAGSVDSVERRAGSLDPATSRDSHGG